MRTVSYAELGERIKKARQDEALVKRCYRDADNYLSQQGLSLEASREFVQKAFVLCDVFYDLLNEAQADAITINSCMSTIMPISETTAASRHPAERRWLSGRSGESDFVTIPCGILLTICRTSRCSCESRRCPHNGVLTVSTALRRGRMDGRTWTVRILTHYESDFGAATKVEMRRGRLSA